jgi:multicomponent Na+:H+ antiporter subunit G
MIVLQWIRLVVASLFLLVGLVPILSAVIGLFRFDYVINRIHASATIDTLAMLSISISLIIMMGFTAAVLKLMLIIAFLWFANPISGHLMARLEVLSNPQIEEEYEVIRIERD